MNPQHLNSVPDKDNRRAVAPYNFVELPEKVVPAESLQPHCCYNLTRHTGTIKCKLTTSSPLYIRCGMSPPDFADFGEKSNEELTDEQRLKRAAFFNEPANQCPTIPGSSLRGMLRTLVEIVSYSKVEQVTDQKLIYRAVADTTTLGEVYRDRLLQKEESEHHRYSFLMKAGYLINDNSQWKIRPAIEIAEETSFAKIEHSQINTILKRPWHELQNACQVTVYVEPLTWHPHRGGHIELYYARAFANNDINRQRQRGVLVTTGKMSGKKMECVVGMPDEDAQTIQIPDEMLQDYKDQVTKEQANILGVKNGALQPMQPIFYLEEEGKLVFFGHTMMFRLPYEKSVTDFIPHRLRDSDTIDLAEAIFGFVRKKKQEKDQARAGRVFVSDAKREKTAADDIWLTGNIEQRVTPKILAGPKPTTFQHYLVQDSAVEEELMHYGNQPVEETVIRGHKLYWHKKENVGRTEIEESNINNINKARSQYTEIKPIKKDVSFEFTIRFENLSQVELGALLWVLNIAADDKYRLSLGMGKPLGMGAVKITHELWLSDRKVRYTHLFQGSDWATGENQDSDKAKAKDCMQKFESHVLQHIGAKQPRLQDVPRIKSLLTMLIWPGLSSNSTRYMEIERPTSQPHIGQPKANDTKINEYKKRPVLPTPLQVAEDDKKGNYPGKLSPSSGGGNNAAAWQRFRKR